MNRKGFTLVELLGVIVVIGLVVGLSTFGIMKAYKNSKEKSLALSKSSILEAARIYATEKINDEDRWIYKNTEGEDYTYFCMTVKELVNNGILDKEKASSFVDDYVVVQKNKITFDIDDLRIVEKKDLSSDIIANNACGNIPDVSLDIPVIEPISSYTDEIDASFTDNNVEGTITKRECLYNKKNDKDSLKGEVTSDNKCIFKGLKSNTEYELKVCVIANGNYKCSNKVNYKTKDIEKPVISISENNKININFKNDNINSKASYYFKSTLVGESSISAKPCVLKDNKFTCQDNETTIIKHNVWYKVEEDSVDITYSSDENSVITARTMDQSDNYSESKKDVSVRKITFYKGIADKIDGVEKDIDYICIAEKDGSCKIKSPSIEKNGYDPIGWNTNENANNSTWNVGEEKSVNKSQKYYPIFLVRGYYVSYVNDCVYSDVEFNKSGTMEDSFYLFGESKKLSENKYECYVNVHFNYNGGATGGNTLTDYKIPLVLVGWVLFDGEDYRFFELEEEVSDLSNKSNDKVILHTVWEIDDNYGRNPLGLPYPFKREYAFDGWYSDSTFETYVGNGGYAYNPTYERANEELYAKWLKARTKITYDYKTNGGTSSTARDTNVSIRRNVPLYYTATKEGWTFVGWNTDKDATEGIDDYYVNGEDEITFYAIFRKDPVTLTAKWDANGANLSSTTTSSCILEEVYNNEVQDTSCTVTAPTITRTGYNILGFNNSVSATNAILNSGQKLTLTTENSNQTWYAITSKNIADLNITVDNTIVEYDGTFKKPTVTIKDGNTTLTNNTDYSLSYSNNKNIGTASINITGKSVYNSATKTFYVGNATRTFTISDNNGPSVEIKLYEGSNASGTAKLTCTSNTNESEKTCTYNGDINGSAYLQISNLTDSGTGLNDKWYFNYNNTNLTSESPNVNNKFLADNEWIEYSTSTKYRTIASGGYRVLWFKFSDKAGNEKTMIIKFNLATCSTSNPNGCSSLYFCKTSQTKVHEAAYAPSGTAQTVTENGRTYTNHYWSAKSGASVHVVTRDVTNNNGTKFHLVCFDNDNYSNSIFDDNAYYNGPFAQGSDGYFFNNSIISFGGVASPKQCGYVYHECLASYQPTSSNNCNTECLG